MNTTTIELEVGRATAYNHHRLDTPRPEWKPCRVAAQLLADWASAGEGQHKVMAQTQNCPQWDEVVWQLVGDILPQRRATTL